MKKVSHLLIATLFILFVFININKNLTPVKASGGEEASYTGQSSFKSSGGKITVSPSTKYTSEETKCKSGGTCNGTCSNTWTDMTKATCGKGTFSMTAQKSPKSAESEYCVPNEAKGQGKISSGNLILDLYSEPTSTQIGTCTCIKGEYCDETEVEQVKIELAPIKIYGASKGGGGGGKDSAGEGDRSIGADTA